MRSIISLGLTGCVLALLCTCISSSPFDDGPAEYRSQAPQLEPRDFVTLTKHAGIKTAVQINPPWHNTECKVGGCTFSYESVSLFYWPSVSQDTACLATLASPPEATPPAGLLVESPSVYVIFTSFYLYDGCGTKLLEAGFDLTTSFAPRDLSTVATAPNGRLTTDPFDFAHLPCPPPGDHVPPGQPYRPLLAPPPFITEIPGWNPSFDGCDPGHGIDPPTALTSALGGISGPGDPGMLHPPREARAYPHPHVAPWAPTRTAGPV